ncbi:threonine synthase [Thermoproteota archaeon]
MKLICRECKEEYSVDDFIYRCKSCDYPLEVNYSISEESEIFNKELLRNRSWNIWRYQELLPIINQKNIISLKEGGTPLIKASKLGELFKLKEVYLKDETRNPTWSFKDRGTAVGVSKGLEIGAHAVGCVSSGNMAASLAAYAARAGMKGLILVPRKTPMSKIAQMLICGGKVASIEAPYPKISHYFLKNSVEAGIYSIHADAPMRVEGQKTVSFEVAEQLGWDIPDWLLIPTSSAGNLSAVWKGWQELNQIGIAESKPKMGVVQAEGNSPIVRSFKKGLDYVEVNKNPETIASAIINPDPPSGKRALRILRESRGYAETASDKEILDAQHLLAKTEGIFAEPAASVPIACMKKMAELGVIDANEKVVILITGSGLKDVGTALKTVQSPIELKSLDEIKNFLGEISYSI